MAEKSSGQAITDPDDIRKFWAACVDEQQDWLAFLGQEPGRRFTHPEIESPLGWVAGEARTVARRMSRTVREDFGGSALPNWAEGRLSRSGRHETWLDDSQAAVIRQLSGAGPVGK